MKYDYCSVSWRDERFYFSTNDPLVFRSISDEIRKRFPQAKFQDVPTLPDGEEFILHCSYIGQSTAAWWVIKLLCADSWEPLGGT